MPTELENLLPALAIRGALRRISQAVATCALVALACVAVPAHAWDRTYLLGLLNATPAGGWVKVNTTKYSSAWATGADALSPSSESDPAKVIIAWSSFAWDSQRGSILLWGGGHANYKGNEMYVWQGTNGQWTRGSVSSRIVEYGTTATYFVVDDAAPQSSHTYDNNIYLPLNDMFVTFGGAAFNTGDVFTIRDANGNPVRAGPWAWDPTKANPNKVGGTTGSGYNPVTAGGNMWTNLQKKFTGTEAPTYVEGATAYAQENGRDIVYVSAHPGSGWPALYRYDPGTIRSGTTGTYQKVGTSWNAPTFKHTAVVDTRHALVIRTANASPYPSGLGVWDLLSSNAANPDANQDIAVRLQFADGTQFVGNGGFGIAYDPVRDKIVLWDGTQGGLVYETRAAFDAAGDVLPTWTITPVASTTSAQPAGNFATGVNGKFHFVAELNAFIALDNYDYTSADAPVWLYKPIGWQAPSGVNSPPVVSITAPTNGTSVTAPATVTVSANATDSDGTITSVKFYAGSTLIGTDTTAPYSITWSNVAVGTYSLTAVAVDDAGASTTSAPVTLTVTTSSSSGNVVLQDGLNGYAGTRDTYLSYWYSSTNYGGSASLNESSAYTDLVRFAIFQSEGGPVPNGATIVSATLSLYKSSSYDYTYRVTRMLRDWKETEATWSQAQLGQAWAVAGANGSATDYAAAADATVTLGWSPQWLNADVTPSLQAMAAGQPNYGWRLVEVSGNGNDKSFWASEYTGDPTLRPKLAIQYTTSANTPPTVSITSPASGTNVAAPATVVVSANASDSDGIARVDFYAGSTLIGSDTTSPYSITWSNVAAGTYSLTAVAFDTKGASTTSAAVTLNVTTGSASTVTLQDGLNGYTGTRDTYLCYWYPSANYGTTSSLLESSAYTDLVRFAIFQSEGGPVPNGATIVSATLSMYKASSYDYTYQVTRMLRDWKETEATWAQWQSGQAWSVAGADGAGSDYSTTPDATVSVGWAPQWLTANVTSSVQAMATGQPNYGWKLEEVSGNGNDKMFWSREYAFDKTLRPKLVIQYK